MQIVRHLFIIIKPSLLCDTPHYTDEDLCLTQSADLVCFKSRLNVHCLALLNTVNTIQIIPSLCGDRDLLAHISQVLQVYKEKR